MIDFSKAADALHGGSAPPSVGFDTHKAQAHIASPAPAFDVSKAGAAVRTTLPRQAAPPSVSFDTKKAQAHIAAPGVDITSPLAASQAATPGTGSIAQRRNFPFANQGTAAVSQMTSALEKAGTVATVAPDLMGAATRDIQTPPAGNNPLERLNNSHVKKALGMMYSDLLRAHNFGDVQGEYYVTSPHNLQVLASNGDKSAQFLLDHPWGNAAATLVGEMLDPVNWTPAGIGAMYGKVRALSGVQKAAQAARDVATAAGASKAGQAVQAFAEHPRVQRIIERARQIHNEAFGSGANILDRAVAPGQEAQAHAARRAELQANTSGKAQGKKLTQLIFGTQKHQADVLPALQAAQRKSKEAWLHQQRLADPDSYARAESFLQSYRSARAANEPGLLPGTYEKVLGTPSVHDIELPDVHHFVQRELSDLEPGAQAHVLKIAREMELAGEGPRMEELSPMQAEIANRFRGVMGYTTAVTHNAAPDLLEHGEQVGFIPSRDIYAFPNSRKGGTRGMNVREKIEETQIPTLYRRLALWKHSEPLPEEDRLLGAAPYSAKTPEQAIEDFLSTRYANLKARAAQPEFARVRSNNGNPLIYEPPLPAMHDPATNTMVVRQDRATLENLVSGAQERAALERMGGIVGMKPAEIDTYLHDRGPQAGVAAGRARQAKSAANQAAKVAGNGAGALANVDRGLGELGPNLARAQQAEEQGVREAVEGRPQPNPGEAVKPTAEERLMARLNKRLDALKERSKARAINLIDRYAPVAKAGRAAAEQIAARPGSRESLAESRGYLKDTQAALDEVAQRFREATQIDPKERAGAVRQIAEALRSDVVAAQEPYWQALSEHQGRIIPDQMWDESKGRFVDQTRFEGLAPNIRGSAKRLREETQADRRYGNLDQITDLLRERLHNPDLTDDDVLEFFKNARKPQLRDFLEEARAQFDDLTGSAARRLQDELVSASRARSGARVAHRENLATAKGISPEEQALTSTTRGLVRKQTGFGNGLTSQLAAGVKATGKAVEDVRGDLGKLQNERRKVGGRVYDVVDNAHLKQSAALQRGVAGAQARLQQFGSRLANYAAKASDESKVRQIAHQYARLTQAQKAHLQSIYKRVLRETPRAQFYPPATYDRNLYVPAKDATVHGIPYPFLDGEGKVVHKDLLRQFEYDHAPYEEADAAAQALALGQQVARGSMVTNAAIHPIFNQGMMYAFETGDWAGLAQHALTVATGLDPFKAVKHLPGTGELDKPLNALLDLAQKSNAAVWKAIEAQRFEFGDELRLIHQYHGYTETAPLEMDTRDFTRPVTDSKGKLVDYQREHDTEMDPAHIETTRAGELPLGGRISKMYRAFARWNHRIVWETSEPLLMARWVRYFRGKGMSDAQAVDAARERLGSDKLTNLWRRSPLLFPRWTRTVLWAALRLGLTKPATWNAPLQATRVEREGVGAGDVPTGLNPMTLALPAGTDDNGAARFEMLGLHDPMATPLNTAAGAAFGDPRYAGVAGHMVTPVEFTLNRLNPEVQAAADTAATAYTGYANRTIPGSYLRASEMKNLTPIQILAKMLYGGAGRFVAPLSNAADTLENPFSIPAGLTGSTLYPRSDGFQYPEQP